MSDIAIHVDDLGKQYLIGIERQQYRTLRDQLQRRLRHIDAAISGERVASVRSSTFWALRNVSFDIGIGEVIGIIGRNGAGKSTLLKILSRITEPTEGRALLYGRVAALLEVGTGFHPELTGSENIFLNGAILGMSRAEIRGKFDEIVSFAEIEKFLNTPVKRYSSGMYVRLAFAVAAFLEPEILLVDEVLAVGDSGFQRKCLGRMNDVAREGRTVLFVSHNMQAIQSLCQRAYLLDSGGMSFEGDVQSVVSQYFKSMNALSCEVMWPASEAPGNDEIRLSAMRVYCGNGPSVGIYQSSQDLCFDVDFDATDEGREICVGFDLISASGFVVLRSYQTDMRHDAWPTIRKGRNRWTCIVPGGILNGGTYYLCPRISVHNKYWIVHADAVAQFEVILDHGVSPLWNSLDATKRPGMISPILQWSVKQ